MAIPTSGSRPRLNHLTTRYIGKTIYQRSAKIIIPTRVIFPYHLSKNGIYFSGRSTAVVPLGKDFTIVNPSYELRNIVFVNIVDLPFELPVQLFLVDPCCPVKHSILISSSETSSGKLIIALTFRIGTSHSLPVMFQ